MKNNHLIHLGWTALLGSLMAVSCQTALETDLAEKNVSYDCTIEVNLDETRTANNGSGTVWVADDALAVMHTSDGSTFYTSRFYLSSDNNEFKGRVDNVSNVSNDWYMFYPYSESMTTPKSVQITVPGSQTQAGNNSTAHLAGPTFPLFGKQLEQPASQQMSVTMANLLGVIKYRVNNNSDAPIVIKRIQLATPVPVSGTFSADLTANNIQWTAAGTTASNLTLNVENGAEIAVEEECTFYVGTIPFTAAAGTQMKIKITAVHPSNPSQEIDYYEVLNLTRDNTVSPNSQKAFPVFNYDDNHQTDPGSGTPTIKIDQDLTFSTSELTWTLGGQYALNGQYDMPQRVAGAHTNVTYTSSNTSVVEIVDNRQVKINGVGFAYITANAVEDDNYNPGSASYKLTIAEAAVVPSSRTYKYVSISNLEPGTYVIAGSESSNEPHLSAALFPTVSVGSWSSTQGNVTNGEYVPHKAIGDNATADSFTTEDADIIRGEVDLVRANTSGTATWKIKVNANGQYLGTPSEQYRIPYVNEASAAAFSISSGQNGATIQIGNYYFFHSGSAKGFTYRTSSTSNIRFYKLQASKQSQTIAFANNNATQTWTLGTTYVREGTYTVPQVSGNVTTVSYDSSNENVATIDGTTLTIKGTGSTIITATAAETSSYYGATAQMTLVIEQGGTTPPTPTETVYKKVTSEEPNWAGTYLFVDEASSKAFAAFSANATSYAVNVTISNGQIAATSDIAKYALTVTDAGVQHGNSHASNQEAYNVQNSDGKYLYVSSSSLQISDSNSRTSGTTTYTYYHAFKYDGGVQVMSANTSSTGYAYYLGYDNNAFSYFGGQNVTASDQAHRVQLYKLTEGTTPTPGKEDQVLSFAQPTVTRTMETASGTLAVQTVQGNKTTPVKYSSSNENVATVNETTITIKGFGSTQIIATAPSSSTYNQGTASYTLEIVQSTPATTGAVYQMATSLTVGGTYLIVDKDNQRLMKGDTDGSFVNVTPSNGVINDTNNSYAGYEFTVTQSGSKYCIIKDGKYLLCDYSNQGNTSTGLVYVDQQPASDYLYTVTENNGVFEFMTAQRNTNDSSKKEEVLYYKSANNVFKIGGSGKGVGVRIYLKTSGSVTPGKQNQNPYFASSAVVDTRATASGTLAVQPVQGAYGEVDYSSSNTSVATVNGTTLTIRGFGETTITANAKGNDSYNPGSASYKLTVVQSSSSTGAVYVKATSLTVGGTYLIVDIQDQRLFKGETDGSFVSISPSNGVINDTNNSYAGYEFTVTQSGSKYCLMHNGKYLIDDYSANGNSSTGLVYLNEKPTDQYLYDCTVNNGVFEFATDQRNSSNTGEVLYYKSSNNVFKIGGSGKGVGVHIYLKESGSTTTRQPQNLSFAQSTVTWTLGTDVNQGGTKTGQSVQNAKTSPVTYNSSDKSVATVNGTQITVVGAGTTVISATAPMDDNYYEGGASYTLNILPSSGVMVYNLENSAVKNYLDYIEAHPYDPTNYGSGTSVVTNYSNAKSDSNRLDWPNPVPVSWSNPSSGNGSKVVYIYNNSGMTDEELHVDVTNSSATSANVYNLIPGHTYYYKVTNNGNSIATGSFMTTGRRRMMKVGESRSNDANANNCRDLGGQITTDGRRIKYGIMFRGTNLDNTPQDNTALDCLLNYMKIGLDVDLREREYNNGKSALGNSVEISNQTYNSMGNLTDASKMGNTLKDIFNAVAAGKHVYIHCAVGADRTGFVCMVLEGLLGIPQNMCDVDYEMTSFSVHPGTRTREISSGWGGSANYYYSGSGKGVTYINDTYTGSTFQDKVIAFAKAMGVTEAQIRTFQNNMLE